MKMRYIYKHEKKFFKCEDIYTLAKNDTEISEAEYCILKMQGFQDITKEKAQWFDIVDILNKSQAEGKSWMKNYDQNWGKTWTNDLYKTFWTNKT